MYSKRVNHVMTVDAGLVRLSSVARGGVGARGCAPVDPGPSCFVVFATQKAAAQVRSVPAQRLATELQGAARARSR